MSKAKELVTQRQEIIQHEKGDWHDLKATAYDLIDAVLSEPEPELKGWIEVTTIFWDNETKMTLNVNDISGFSPKTQSEDYNRDANSLIYLRRSDECFHVKESYDSIKQKIKEAL